MDTALDNPFWLSLSTRHRHLSIRHGDAARFPADYAPFLAIPKARAVDEASLEALVAANETVYLLGEAPALSERWQLQVEQELAQMVCASPIALRDGPEMVELTESRRDDALALTALVYPHFFRQRTMELGRYFGIDVDGRLAAMIGERLGSDDSQELSAICTHPDFEGRGYGRRLLAALTNDNLERGRLPFLHVSLRNTRALSMYEHAGFRRRREMPFWSLRRAVNA